MALTQYTFQDLNMSAQVGDTVYYIDTTVTQEGFTSTAAGQFGLTGLVCMGFISNITRNVDSNGLIEGTQSTDLVTNTITVATAPFNHVRITVDDEDTFLIDDEPPTTNSFIFFAKDNRVNASSVKGYYASVEFRNDSIEKAEMFTASCDVTESSK
tara:strand:- start:4880 stop:5347 length:468 start_codon:yes stop_codon:yes gene_type:complete